MPSKKRRTLFNGVMAAQQILVLLVKVRILVEQQKNPEEYSGFFLFSYRPAKMSDKLAYIEIFAMSIYQQIRFV